MNQRIGTCSICGGDVYGHVGAWWSINPPPPARCTSCGAVEASDIIKMAPSPQPCTKYESKTSTNEGTA